MLPPTTLWGIIFTSCQSCRHSSRDTTVRQTLSRSVSLKHCFVVMGRSATILGNLDVNSTPCGKNRKHGGKCKLLTTMQHNTTPPVSHFFVSMERRMDNTGSSRRLCRTMFQFSQQPHYTLSHIFPPSGFVPAHTHRDVASC